MSEDVKKLENLAYHNAPMPKDLELPEQLLFLSLRFLYGSFKHKQVNEATAKTEKNQLTNSYEHFKFMSNMFKKNVQMQNKLSHHILQINKNGCEMCKKAVAIFTNMRQV